MNHITHISGKHLYYAFLAGAKRILEEQQYLNKINVFPVPDGDTGTNMASTVQAIVDNTVVTDSYKTTALSIADAALVGARGNSGIIFAQFLFGASNDSPAQPNISISEFIDSIRSGVQSAYDAIANPVEGTIITVLRVWMETMDSLKGDVDDFVELLEKSFPRLKEALQETKKQLPKLAKSQVVDSGAQAFVFFIEGTINFLTKGTLKDLIGTRSQTVGEADDTHIDHEEITFRYCTEGMLTVTNDDLDLKDLRKQLNRLGDSIVVAGSKTRMRIHIHTDAPAKVFNILARYGNIDFQKVDDMEFQQELTTLGPKHRIGLMIDSCADLPKALREQHQMHLIPLNLHMDNSQYLDRITITPNQFYRMQRRLERPNTSTSQPSKKDFINKYSYMSGIYDSVISLNVSSALSGTYQNSIEAAGRVSLDSGKRISAIDTKLCSGTQGLVAMRVAEAIAAGKSHADILEDIEGWIKRSMLYVNTMTLKNFIRSGRISHSKGFIGNLLNLRPIISMNPDGSGNKIGSFRGKEKCIEHSLSLFRKAHEEKGIDCFCVCYTDQAELKNAEEVLHLMEEICGQKASYITQLSPVLGSIGGNGALEIAFITKS